MESVLQSAREFARVSAPLYARECTPLSAPVSARESPRMSSSFAPGRGAIVEYATGSAIQSVIESAWASAQGSTGAVMNGNHGLPSIQGNEASNASAKETTTSSGTTSESGSDSKGETGKVKDKTKVKATSAGKVKTKTKSKSKSKGKNKGKANKDVTTNTDSAQGSEIVGSIVEEALDIAGKQILPDHPPEQGARSANGAAFEPF